MTAFRYLRAGQEGCGTFGLLEENPKELKVDGVGQKKDMPSTNKSNKSHKDDLNVLGLQSCDRSESRKGEETSMSSRGRVILADTFANGSGNLQTRHAPIDKGSTSKEIAPSSLNGVRQGRKAHISEVGG